MSDAEAPSTPQRLVKGAGVMAALWRRGDRCTALWSFAGECSCAKPSTFCRARREWMKLLLQSGELDARGVPEDPVREYSIFELMTAAELKATGFTITSDNGLRVGPKGNVSVDMAVAVHSGVAHGAASIVRLLKLFPNSKITGVEIDSQVAAGAPA